MGNVLVIKGVSFSANKLDTIEFTDSVPCTAISLNKNSTSFNEVGATETLTATVTPSNTTNPIIWTTSDSSVVTVNNGIITAVANGTATITAICGTKTATCTVTVEIGIDAVLVPWYTLAKSSSTGNWASIETVSGSSTNNCILACDSSDTSKYPLTYDNSVDTSPYRFIPIQIPTGTTTIRISSEYQLKTRFLFYNSTQHETFKNYGAKVIQGATSGFDQTDFSTTLTFTVPNGADSFASYIYVWGIEAQPSDKSNHIDAINIEFLTT